MKLVQAGSLSNVYQSISANYKKRSFHKSLVFSFVLLLFPFLLFAIAPPKNVIVSFDQKFPQAGKPRWTKIKTSEVLFQAKFKLNSKKYVATFHENGLFHESKNQVKESELPDAVKNTLISQNAGEKHVRFIEAFEINKEPAIKMFQVTILLDGKKTTLLINMDGSFTYN